jgi:hypothetical protein
MKERKCQTCSIAFSDYAKLKEHLMNSIECKRVMHCCEQCGKWVKKTYFKRHVILVHPCASIQNTASPESKANDDNGQSNGDPNVSLHPQSHEDLRFIDCERVKAVLRDPYDGILSLVTDMYRIRRNLNMRAEARYDLALLYVERGGIERHDDAAGSGRVAL